MYSEIPVNGKRKREERHRNQDAGITEFRDMVLTQRGNERLAGIAKAGHCIRNGLQEIHVLKGLQRLGRKERKQRDIGFSGHPRFKKLPLV